MRLFGVTARNQGSGAVRIRFSTAPVEARIAVTRPDFGAAFLGQSILVTWMKWPFGVTATALVSYLLLATVIAAVAPYTLAALALRNFSWNSLGVIAALAVVAAFWYVVSLNDPDRLKAWLADHPADVATLRQILDGKR